LKCAQEQLPAIATMLLMLLLGWFPGFPGFSGEVAVLDALDDNFDDTEGGLRVWLSDEFLPQAPQEPAPALYDVHGNLVAANVFQHTRMERLWLAIAHIANILHPLVFGVNENKNKTVERVLRDIAARVTAVIARQPFVAKIPAQLAKDREDANKRVRDEHKKRQDNLAKAAEEQLEQHLKVLREDT
jgi:hypothetical protein